MLRDAVDTVADRHRCAVRDVDNAGPIGRRRARKQVNRAAEELGMARHGLDEYRSSHAGLLNERANVAALISPQRGDAATRDTLDSWDHLLGQVARLEYLAQALTIWRSWAEGRPVREEELIAELVALRGFQNEWTPSLVQSIFQCEPTLEALHPPVRPDLGHAGIEIDL